MTNDKVLNLFNKFSGREIDVITKVDHHSPSITITFTPDPKDLTVREMKKVAKDNKLVLKFAESRFVDEAAIFFTGQKKTSLKTDSSNPNHVMAYYIINHHLKFKNGKPDFKKPYIDKVTVG